MQVLNKIMYEFFAKDDLAMFFRLQKMEKSKFCYTMERHALTTREWKTVDVVKDSAIFDNDCKRD